MSADWPILSLREAGVSLIDCEHRTPPAAARGYPYIAIPQIRAGRINLAEARQISKDHFAEWTRKARPRDHDVVLSRRCNPGETGYVEVGMDFALGQNLVILRADGRVVLPQFLRWLVRGVDWWEQVGKFLNVGAVFDSLKCADIPKFQMHIPPMPLQRMISETLGSLDDKIDLNRQMNETLEAMARAVFRSWFVDFDPVHAKADGRKPDGLDAATAKLFPDKFEDSSLGPVPMGWRVMPLPEAIEVNPRRSLSKGVSAPYLDMSNMPTRSARATTWEMREGGSGARFVNGDLLLARITPCLENGKTAFVDFLPDGQTGWGSTEYIVLRSKQPLPEEYAYFLARSPELRMFAIQNMTGTSGRQRVPADCFSNFFVVVPPDGLARRFGDLAKVAMSQMKARDEESATLAAIRDSLLPKLLSGEVRVTDAQHLLKEAT